MPNGTAGLAIIYLGKSCAHRAIDLVRLHSRDLSVFVTSDLALADIGSGVGLIHSARSESGEMSSYHPRGNLNDVCGRSSCQTISSDGILTPGFHQ